MLILSQTNDMSGFHGKIGTPTNMYDYHGSQLFVGDVVVITTYGRDNTRSDDYGIEFVCEEDTKIAEWTGEDKQYVMGIASIYNNHRFEAMKDFSLDEDAWGEEFVKNIDPEFRVFKVKSFEDLVIGEKISFIKVVEVKE